MAKVRAKHNPLPVFEQWFVETVEGPLVDSFKSAFWQQLESSRPIFEFVPWNVAPHFDRFHQLRMGNIKPVQGRLNLRTVDRIRLLDLRHGRVGEYLRQKLRYRIRILLNAGQPTCVDRDTRILRFRDWNSGNAFFGR